LTKPKDISMNLNKVSQLRLIQ